MFHIQTVLCLIILMLNVTVAVFNLLLIYVSHSPLLFLYPPYKDLGFLGVVLRSLLRFTFTQHSPHPSILPAFHRIKRYLLASRECERGFS